MGRPHPHHLLGHCDVLQVRMVALHTSAVQMAPEMAPARVSDAKGCANPCAHFAVKTSLCQLRGQG